MKSANLSKRFPPTGSARTCFPWPQGASGCPACLLLAPSLAATVADRYLDLPARLQRGGDQRCRLPCQGPERWEGRPRSRGRHRVAFITKRGRDEGQCQCGIPAGWPPPRHATRNPGGSVRSLTRRLLEDGAPATLLTPTSPQSRLLGPGTVRIGSWGQPGAWRAELDGNPGKGEALCRAPQRFRSLPRSSPGPVPPGRPGRFVQGLSCNYQLPQPCS